MRAVIANRGEVAVRLIRACQELGYRAILLHSTVDKGGLAYRLADETIELAGETSRETYLDAAKVVAAAKAAKADFLHPGFGFLSENAEFAAAVEKAGIRFVGPNSKAIAKLGDKTRAKALAEKLGIPIIPAFTEATADDKKMLAGAKKLGFPVIIKAAAGGGGKGMKVVAKETDFLEQLASSQREAKAAFGDDAVFIEKLLKNPRHVEIQIVGDRHGNMVHFGERDCTVQRRFQKIIEESPSGAVDQKLRDQLTAAASKLCKAAGYDNAGTVEFMLDTDGSYYFMEMNTRLQVEHPVTELVYGVDLVKLQFAVANGKKIPWPQTAIRLQGHAIEVRLYAEDPAQQFLPSTGRLELIDLPLGPHRRFDFGYATGDTISQHYDPMIGKIITWAPTRQENLQRLLATLNETVIFGIHTNIEFLKSVSQNALFVADTHTTGFLQQEYQGTFAPPALTEELRAAIYAAAAAPSVSTTTSLGGTAQQSLFTTPWVKS